MKITKLPFVLLSLFIIILACSSDDDITPFVERDRAEVFAEDLAEIEEYLQTHTYNYDEFDFNNLYSLANDTFEIVFEAINEDNNNLDAIPLINRPELTSKIVTDNGIDYTLYYLNLREGLGDVVDPLDAAAVIYEGTLLDGSVFDSNLVTPIAFPLTSDGILIAGVVIGFKEAIIEFKTRDGFTENGDGTITNHNHGIGATFIPSGIGFFSNAQIGIPAYSPLIFRINLITRLDTDFDGDNVASFIEDLNDNGDGNDDDTDGDGIGNFIDNDDDNDGVLTRDEDLEDTDLNFDSDGDGDPTNDKNGDGDPTNDDTDGDGIPNYLDADSNESN